MSLNIKRPETHRMAERLSALTGESLTDAVTEAIRERLERVQRVHDTESRLARIREISRSFRNGLGESVTSTDHGDLLYDDTGLPK
jgi:antitoxin VapB